MTRLILLISILPFAFNAKSQTVSINQSDIDFINYAVKDKRYRILLVSEMLEYNLNEIKKYVDRGFFIKRMSDENDKDISDTIKLNTQDKDTIYLKLDKLKEFKWTSTDAQKLNLDRIEVIGFDSSRSDRLEYAIKYHIVPPIYFHNNTYCLLNFSYNCGGLCGHGQITIYKKTTDGWKRWNNLAWWDE
jgi:hypothetical protein